MTSPRYTWRVVMVTLLMMVVWTGLGIRLALLHLGSNENFHSRIENIRYREEKLLGLRGRILDREGQMCALDLSVFNVCASPEDVMSNRQVRAVSGHLSRLLNIELSKVEAKLTRKGRFFETIKENVHQEAMESVKRLQLKGVFFREDTARYYPLGSQLCHVLGFSNKEGVGSAGIELRMDRYLRGRSGVQVSEKDGKRREVYGRRTLEIQPEAGSDVYLTIDQKLQHFVERELSAAVEQHQAEGGWAIIQRVKTGEILAMASRPDFDLNEYGTSVPSQRMNRAISYVYEPGSTMKAMVVAAALNEGLVKPEDIIDCENGMWFYNGRSLRDFHPYGLLSVADVIKKSSNIGTAKIAIKLGERRLARYLSDFGIGKKTGIELPGEEVGIFHSVDRWTKISISRIPMGHEVGVTALQILNAYCTLANDGFMMKPYVIDRVVDPRGMVIMKNEPEVMGRPVREDAARIMCGLLGRVTEQGGTARRAQVEGYSVAGKTGTAQKPIPGGYSDHENIASFVGFLPAEDPEIGLIVVIDNPQPEHTGGVVAAPIFKLIAEQAIRYLDIPPIKKEDVLVTSTP